VTTPHTPEYNPTSHADAGLADGRGNLCRNPDGSKDEIWCYTNDEQTEFEFCSPLTEPVVCAAPLVLNAAEDACIDAPEESSADDGSTGTDEAAVEE